MSTRHEAQLALTNETRREGTEMTVESSKEKSPWSERTKMLALLLATTMGLALLLSGVALAVTTVHCGDPTVPEYTGCTGTPKADEIFGTIEDDDVSALGGPDTVYTLDGNDVVQGGGGDELVYGQDGNDSLYGQGGNDTLYGQTGSNILSGGDGNDTLIAAGQFDPTETDRVDGGRGNDTIDAVDGGVDEITCGASSKDRVDYDQYDSVDHASCEIERMITVS